MNGVNNVRSDVNRRILRLFREHGIRIPVSQHEVRVVEAGAVALRPARGEADAGAD
jgi:small-conductance mechanosensitive channel